MSLPPHAELLGEAAAPLSLRGGNTTAIIPLSPAAQSGLAARLAALAHTPGRIYLLLEQVRGTSGAAVLGIYVNLPDAATPAAHPELRADTIALYGLRQASAGQPPHEGQGLSFTLDVTPILAAARALPPGLRITIVADQPALPTDITIGSLRLFGVTEA